MIEICLLFMNSAGWLYAVCFIGKTSSFVCSLVLRMGIIQAKITKTNKIHDKIFSFGRFFYSRSPENSFAAYCHVR